MSRFLTGWRYDKRRYSGAQTSHKLCDRVAKSREEWQAVVCCVAFFFFFFYLIKSMEWEQMWCLHFLFFHRFNFLDIGFWKCAFLQPLVQLKRDINIRTERFCDFSAFHCLSVLFSYVERCTSWCFIIVVQLYFFSYFSCFHLYPVMLIHE